ncbi:MAG TPA: MFS transporter [Acidimicrobiales bacterium]|nr:MFS transporter [Acidimicrobiales bacterium]
MPTVRAELTWRPLALLVAGALFMENLDGTIIVTATQRMALTFGVPVADLNVAIAAYLLALGIFIPVSGWVADRFGARTTFAVATAVFTLASGLCAISANLEQLTAMRVLQGIGGAMMVPVGRLVVLRATTKGDLIKAIAYLTWPALVAPVVAPVAGGLLTTYASWRWIFVINVPLGFVAFFIALRIVPRAGRPVRLRLDWLGFAVTATALALVAGGLEIVTFGTVKWLPIVLTLVTGAFLMGTSVYYLSRSSNPLLNLGVFQVHTFRVTNVGGSLFRMAIGAAPFLLPLLFEEGFGWGPVKASLVVVPIFVGNIAVKPLTTPILRRWGFRTVLITSCLVSGATLALCATFTLGLPFAIVVLVLLASGVSRSVGYTAYNTIVFADVGEGEMNNANTLTTTIQQLTVGFGVAVGGLALHAGPPIDHLLGASGRGPEPFTVAFLLIAVLPLLGAIECAWLSRDAGSALTTPAPPVQPAS